ncbi:MAG: phosphopantetheine-binding protein [Acidobacteriota bacterium]
MEDAATQSDLKQRVCHLIVDRLKLETEPGEIDTAASLFGEDGLGLDSIDALELVLGVEQEFGVRIEDEEVGSTALASVDSLAGFIASQSAESS